MTMRKDHKPEPGSLEAALRDLNHPTDPDPVVPPHAEDPTELRPGEHTQASPRTFNPPDASMREQRADPGYTLWGRCGYIPSPRVQGAER
jgi:hypothetical protein